MKLTKILLILAGGFVVVLLVRGFGRSGEAFQYRAGNPYAPSGGDGKSPGGILTAVSNSFLSLFNAGVFGTGWGQGGQTNVPVNTQANNPAPVDPYNQGWA